MPSKSPLPQLNGAHWLQRPETQQVFAALNRNGHEARAVGGAVRNAILGVPVHDVDIAATSPPEETVRLAEAAGLKAIPTGIAHGTITVVADHVPFEITTLRTDVETDGRHARVAFTADWAADARRRDFTLNALYCDASGSVHDPLDGYADLAARRVRFIGDASERIREDYLRILRFFRFSGAYAEGYLDPAGLSACRELRDGLRELSRERVRTELLRLLVTPHAADVLAQVATDILPLILPDGSDVRLFTRVVEIERALQRAPDAIVRLGALAGTRPGLASKIQASLRLSSHEFEQLARLSMPDRAFDPDTPEREAKAFIYRHGAQAFVDGTLLAWARGTVPAGDADFSARFRLPERWQTPTLPVRGSDITDLGVPPGPRIGNILAAFEDWWITADFADDPALLAARLSQLVNQSAN